MAMLEVCVGVQAFVLPRQTCHCWSRVKKMSVSASPSKSPKRRFGMGSGVVVNGCRETRPLFRKPRLPPPSL